jgi:hypothetical protein
MGSGLVGTNSSKRPRFIGRIALALTTAATGVLAFAASASAATETFDYTGSAQTWTVPAGVTSATFDVYGAQGAGFVPGAFGGVFDPVPGGRATATIAVSPGASIQVNVGGRGLDDQGGFNGGGDGRFGGGGASDIRIGGTTLDDRALVAGGGGGAGGISCNGANARGGKGGGTSGESGNAGCETGEGGGGGTQTGGGSAGGDGTPGGLGLGGSGGSFGGGGGGGYYGGGGGQEGGGGGGSGYGPAGTTFETGVRSGDGLVTVTYTEPVTIADLIDSVNALNVAKGTKNSLLKKLNGAQKNLNSGDTGGACDKLASFISQVKALRGK